MTIIKIQKHNKELLRSCGDGSYNDIVCQLIHDAGDKMPIYDAEDTISSSMRLNDDTLDLLDGLKVVPSESYESVIVRLCLLWKDLNNTTI